MAPRRWSPFPRDGVSRLETLPNLDINIKCGNSLISRFALDADLGEALRKKQVEHGQLPECRSCPTGAPKPRAQKHAMEKLIGDIKSDFETEVSPER